MAARHLHLLRRCREAATAAGLALVLCRSPALGEQAAGAAGGGVLAAPPPIDLSRGLAALELGEDELANHELLSRWFGEAFHSLLRYDSESWLAVRQQLEGLAVAAVRAPELAFAVGSVFYSYFWWGDGTAIDVPAGERAVRLLRAGLDHTGCGNPALTGDSFVNRQCHMRWRQVLLVSAEVARYLALDASDVRRAAVALREATSLMQVMRELPFFETFRLLGASLQEPHDMNYNMDYYPHVNVGPVWPKEWVPLASFLEEHFDVFLAELQQFRDAETFWGLHRAAFVSETQFTPQDEDWQTVYLFMNQKFVEQNCKVAPRTCELLRSRPELGGCRASSAGAGFVRLRPGARLKPHFGNGPRLTAHLGLEVPEVGDIHMTVGSATLRWQRGRALIFDDTYIHKVRHDGLEPRFVLLLWFCHPCDSEHWDNPPEQQPEVCRWPH